MNVEVFIYGTPTGNCFYGKTDEKIYFDTFYNGDKANYLSVKIKYIAIIITWSIKM